MPLLVNRPHFARLSCPKTSPMMMMRFALGFTGPVACQDLRRDDTKRGSRLQGGTWININNKIAQPPPPPSPLSSSYIPPLSSPIVHHRTRPDHLVHPRPPDLVTIRQLDGADVQTISGFGVRRRRGVPVSRIPWPITTGIAANGCREGGTSGDETLRLV